MSHVCNAIFPSSHVSRHFVIISRISRVQVIAAEGEQKASRALRDASEVIAESSAALQLRYLQVSRKRPASGFSLCWKIDRDEDDLNF
jgi:hypothetical protein